MKSVCELDFCTYGSLSIKTVNIYFSLVLLDKLYWVLLLSTSRELKLYFFKALHFIGNSMNKMIYPVRMHSYLFLFWATLQVCSINLEYLSCPPFIFKIQPLESKTEDRQQGWDSGREDWTLKWEEVSEEDLRCSREWGRRKHRSWPVSQLKVRSNPQDSAAQVRPWSEAIARALLSIKILRQIRPLTPRLGIFSDNFYLKCVCAFWQSQAPNHPTPPRPHHAWGWEVECGPSGPCLGWAPADALSLGSSACCSVSSGLLHRAGPYWFFEGLSYGLDKG